MAGNGVTGFIALAGREPWGLQLLIDLLVMLALFALWVRQDARKHGLPVLALGRGDDGHGLGGEPWPTWSTANGSCGGRARLARALRSRNAVRNSGDPIAAWAFSFRVEVRIPRRRRTNRRTPIHPAAKLAPCYRLALYQALGSIARNKADLPAVL